MKNYVSGRASFLHRISPIFASLFVLCIGLSPAAHAAVRFWDGSSSGNWTTAANWSTGVAPVAGDDLVFPGGAAVLNLNNTNNFAANTVFSSITISGTNYILNGSPLALSASPGISAQNVTGLNTINFDIRLDVAQIFECTSAGATLDINGDINNNTFLLTVNAVGDVNLGGLISGTGGLIKNGAGTLLLNGSVNNTYGGTTTVNAGTLELNDNLAPLNAMVPGDIIINPGATLLLTEGNQIADTSDVAVRGTGLFNLNGLSETIASLTLSDGGDVTTGVGTLTLGGNITASAVFLNSASISGNLSLGGATRTISVTDNVLVGTELFISADISGSGSAGITKTGGGNLSLSGVNTYPGLTTVSGAFITAANAAAFGSSAAGTVLSGGSILLSGVTVANESLTNNSTISVLEGLGGVASAWTSNIVLNADLDILVFTNGTLNLSGIISGTGGVTKSEPGTLLYSGLVANSYIGDTTVNEGVLELGKLNVVAMNSSQLIIGDGTRGVETDIVRYVNDDFQLPVGVSITVNDTGLLDLNGFDDDVRLANVFGGRVRTFGGLLTLGGGSTTTASSSALGTAVIDGNLSLGGSVRTFSVTNGPFAVDLQVDAVVSSAGGITKSGDGFMSLTGSNTFTGAVTVNDGTLRLQDDFAAGTTAGGVTVNGDAILQLISSSHVGAEALTLNSTQANGAVESITGSNSWAGTVTLSINTIVNVDAGDTLNLLGSITGPGGLTKVDTGTLIYSGATANTYAGVTTVNAGTLVLDKSVLNSSITNDLVIGDGIGGVNADVVRNDTGTGQIGQSVQVTITDSGLLDLDGTAEVIGSLAGSGNVSLVGGSFFTGGNDDSTSYAGVISGAAGELQKDGTGTFVLSGNNTYTGTTTVDSGTLLVNSSQPQSPVSVSALGILGGSGTVGNINNVSGGIVAPGSSPGILTSSNVNFSGVSSDFTVEINGPRPGTGYDQLNVRGTNNLGGSTLNVSVGGGFAPTEGQIFTIIANDGAEIVTGTFAGLPDNSILTSGIHKFRIDYGNDVTLTYTNPPLVILNPQVSAGNGNLSIDPNECNNLNLVITNTSGILMSGISAVLSSTTPGVVITQPESAYPNIAINGKGTNTTPFQISTLTNFNCSDTIELTLTVTTASGNVVTLFSLPSGSEGTPVPFNNINNLGITDAGSVTSSIVVASITTPIKKVTVSLHITHTTDEDLDISLVGPDGTTIRLSDDNGGTGDDYGTDCVDGRRTVFDDAAASSIALVANTPPYVGTFRPEQQLSAFIGKEGVDVNGTWKLIVTDDSGGSVGTLRCWSLFISPTACAPGGGFCDTCPGVVSGTISTNDFTNSIRVLREGSAFASTCAAPKACPGAIGDANTHYDTHTFTNTGGPACVTVHLDDPCGNLFATAYLGSYNLADLCANYLGDKGNSGAVGNFSFNVPANTNFVVVVNDVPSDGGGVGCAYTLVAIGTECPPLLDIDPVPGNKVRLHWPTTAGGFLLNASDVLVPANFLPVPDQPIVFGGEYNVTNNVTGTNKFYQLIKP